MIKTINARFDCRGYYLRWYFNGWHHYFFKVADEIQQTEGQKYQTQMSTKLVVGDDNIRKNQMLAFTGLMRSKHIFMLTEDGWKACTIVDTDLPYGRADHPGARVEFTLNVWAKKGLFTPLLEVNVRVPPPPPSLYNLSVPEGWLVPTRVEWEAERDTWATEDRAGAFGSDLKVPAAGSRGRVNGDLSNLGSAGVYWMSTIANELSFYTLITSTSVSTQNVARANGLSIRLIKKPGLSLVAGEQTFRYMGADWVYQEVENPTTGRIWMDRNLGASRVANAFDDADSYGDLFQWGRNIDGHQERTSGTTAVLSDSDIPGHPDFITNTTSPFDWRDPQNDNLWQPI